MRPKIDKDMCMKCEECMDTCPYSDIIFSYGYDDAIVATENDLPYCEDCGECVENCPVDAITLID